MQYFCFYFLTIQFGLEAELLEFLYKVFTGIISFLLAFISLLGHQYCKIKSLSHGTFQKSNP